MSRPYRLNKFKPRLRTDHLGAECELTIERLSDEGSGLAHWQQQRVFVPKALPGERIRVRIVSSDRHGLHGQLLSILANPSPDRIDPPCEYYQDCGGCQLQHLAYDAQLAHRQRVAQRRLARVVPEATWQSPMASQVTHYRHRVRLQVQAGKQINLGFRQSGSHRLVPVSQCLQLQPALNAALSPLRTFLATLEQPARIEEIRIAQGEGQGIGIQLKTKNMLTAGDMDRLANVCTEKQWLGELVNGAGRVLWQNLATQSLLRYPGDGEDGVLSGAGDFTQANPVINHAMRHDAVAWLAPEPDSKVAEFFSGLGNFSFALARSGCALTGYELSSGMVARADERARALGYDRVRFEVANLFAEDQVAALQTALTDCRHVLLDPPRAGARALCRALGQWVINGQCSLQRLVYVSCNSLMLSGDLEPLLAAGFRVERARVYDMFPQTHHFETMLLLCRD